MRPFALVRQCYITNQVPLLNRLDQLVRTPTLQLQANLACGVIAASMLHARQQEVESGHVFSDTPIILPDFYYK